MTRIQLAVAALAALASWFVEDGAAQSCSGVSGRYQARMGTGYRSSVIATGLRSPRHIVVDTAGNLLVAEGGSGSVRRLVLTEQSGSVCVQSNTAITNDRSVSQR